MKSMDLDVWIFDGDTRWLEALIDRVVTVNVGDESVIKISIRNRYIKMFSAYIH